MIPHFIDAATIKYRKDITDLVKLFRFQLLIRTTIRLMVIYPWSTSKRPRKPHIIINIAPIIHLCWLWIRSSRGCATHYSIVVDPLQGEGRKWNKTWRN